MVSRLTEWIDPDALPPCSLHRFDLVITQLADGTWLSVPILVAAGSQPHPRLTAIAGVHGDEPAGILALLDFWNACNPHALKGTLVLVPVANPSAFRAGQRRSPLDNLDLNRTFPGKADGSPTERLAHRLLSEVIPGADFIFTMHSWYSTGMTIPYVEAPMDSSAISMKSVAAAKAAGFRRLRDAQWPEGLLVRAANALGIPGMEAEIGGEGAATPEDCKAYVEHLTRLLRHLGIIAGIPPSCPEPAVYSRGQVFAPSGGVLRLATRPGDHVEAGALLATITNLHGEQVAEMRAPFAGLIVAARTSASVNPGDHVFALFPPKEGYTL